MLDPTRQARQAGFGISAPAGFFKPPIAQTRYRQTRPHCIFMEINDLEG